MEEAKKEELKRFKVLKRTEYENEMNLENMMITIATLGTGVSAIFAIWYIAKSAMENDINNLYTLTGLLELGCSLNSLKVLIKSIIKKTNLKIKVDDIDEELEMLENSITDISEESRGMSK